MQQLVRSPDQTVSLMRERVRPVTKERILQFLKDLDDDNFDVRDRASTELARYGKYAEPTFRRVLEGKPSVEVRRRISELLGKIREETPPPEVLQALRGVEMLEMIGDADARRLLAVLADGAPDFELTMQAREAMERLKKRR
jgi:hypothetical protein